MSDFQKWWSEEGSSVRPREGDDFEEFARSIAEIAWSNGAQKAELERDQLRSENDELKKQISLYKNMSTYPREDNYCGHHFVNKRCTICGKVVTQNIFDTIGG